MSACAVHHQPEPLQHFRPHRGTQRIEENRQKAWQRSYHVLAARTGPAHEPLSQRRTRDSRIAHDGRFLQESAVDAGTPAAIRDLNDLAAERRATLAEMALAWLLHDGYVTSVLVGASRPQQLLDNIGALKNTTFSDEELRRIDEISLR